MYKRLLTLIIVFFAFNILGLAQPSPASADEILKEAYQQAAKEKKNVFVLFHASWCGWCHKMDTAMNDPVCKKFFTDNYVITHLVVYESEGKKNLENPGAMDMLTKYNGNDKGIPYWLVFDAKGKQLADSRLDNGDNMGCPASEPEVNKFLEVLKKTARLTETQLEVVRKRFRLNEAH